MADWTEGLPDWASSDRGDVVGFYDENERWIHLSDDKWVFASGDYKGDSHPPPTERDLMLSDTMAIAYTNSEGDKVVAMIHGGIDHVYPLDYAIRDLDDRESGEPYA